MLNLVMPTEKWQLTQFKLYTGYFIHQLEDKSQHLFTLTMQNISQLNKGFVNTDTNPYQELSERFNAMKLYSLKCEKAKLQINSDIQKLKTKVNHSIDVAESSKKVAKELGLLNKQNIELLWTCGLLHDIGRFMQLIKTNTFKDYDSFEKKTPLSSLLINGNFIVDHGELGQIILKSTNLIKRFVPTTRIYDDFIATVVGNHVKTSLPISLSSKIDNSEKIFLDYSFKELFKNERQEEINKLASWYLKIIQDTDRIDILRQVERGDFNPRLSSAKEDRIHEYPYELFYNGQILNMREIKSMGLWNDNVGQLVRWSFIYQLSLVSLLKEIKNSKLITKVWEKNKIKHLESGYNFINELMDALIESSEDGIYVNKEKALRMIKKS